MTRKYKAKKSYTPKKNKVIKKLTPLELIEQTYGKSIGESNRQEAEKFLAKENYSFIKKLLIK